MKLYIPTCTLNFNNIFATASISPKMFYTHRRFGNKRFYAVEPNNLDYAITLYNKIPFFEISSDIENYPIVIEIDTEDYALDYFEEISDKNGVAIFICNKTIYFNPFHSKVIFFDYVAIQNTLTKAQQSLENKFSLLYQNNFIVKRHTKKNFFGAIFTKEEDDNFFTWDSSYFVQNKNDISVDYSLDEQIDRIRGFVYCYSIGKSLSVSPEIAKLKALARRMRNTLSSIVNSPEHHPTQAQDDSITNDIIEFNSIYSKVDDVTKYNNEIIFSNLQGSEELGIPKEKIIRCFKLNHVFDSYCNRLNLRKTYNAYDLMSCLDAFTTERYEQVLRNLQTAVNHIEVKGRTSSDIINIADLISVSGLKITIKEPFNKQFYEELVNSQIKAEYLELMAQKGISENESLGLAYNGGAILKRILGDNWEGSDASSYINSLLMHLQSNEAFEIFDIKSDVLQSFAAFCQKGDNIDRLVEYLTQLGFSNYKLAYGLYGATRGFASLPKTFTRTLIDGDKKQISNFISSLYKQVFSIDLSNTILPEDPTSNVTVSSKIGTTIIQNIDKVEPRAKKQEQIVRAVSETAKLEIAVQDPKAFMYILDSFPRIKNTNAYKKLIKADFENDNGKYDSNSFRQRIYSIIGEKDLKSQQDKIDRAIELESLRDDPDAFLKILDNFLSPSDPAYKKIKVLLYSTMSSFEIPQKPVSTKVAKEKQSKQSQPTLDFKEDNYVSNRQEPNSIISDNNAKMFLLSCNFLGYYKEQVVNLFDEFIKNYRSGFYSMNPQQYKRNNNDVIDHFCKYCFTEKIPGRKTKPLIKGEQTSRMMDKLKEYLLKKYHD